jgi:hypothetical protein
MKALNRWFGRISLLVTAGAWLGSMAPQIAAAPPERDGLPPGLQKKDKLPPGWQKKVGQNGSHDGTSVATNANGSGNGAGTTTTTTTTSTSTTSGSTTTPVRPKSPPVIVTTTPTTPTTPTPPTPPTPPTTPTTPNTPSNPTTTGSTALRRPLTREQRANLDRMERALSDLEVQAARPGAGDRLLHRLSNRLNIPMTTLQAQLRNQPGLSVTHLYLATIIAKEGRVTSEQVLQERKGGTSWADIALNLKVPYSDLAERLRAAEDAAREAANEEQAKVRKQAQRTN